MHYRLVNSDEKNRMKNNDKSIAALEGKSLLYDNPQEANEQFSGNVWKYQKTHSEYQKKLLLKEKYARHLGIKLNADPDKSLGKLLKLYKKPPILSFPPVLNSRHQPAVVSVFNKTFQPLFRPHREFPKICVTLVLLLVNSTL